MNTKPHKVALITGAAQGLGRGIAESLLRTGYAVVLVDRDADALYQAVEDLDRYRGQALACVADVTEEASVAAAVAQAEASLGSISVLVNNAGVSRDRLLMKMIDADWDNVMRVNTRSLYVCCRAVLPAMIERRQGRIVNISSRAWLGNRGQTNYSASKGAVISFTRSLALEMADSGITVNAIAPGIHDTPMFRKLDESVREKLAKSVPVGRVGTPDDIAAAVEFFADDRASYVTGQTLYVCGGRSLAGMSV